MDIVRDILNRLTARLTRPVSREAIFASLRATARTAVLLLLIVYLSLVCSFFFVGYPGDNSLLAHHPNFHVDTATGRIKDKHGRERVFHGVNVVFKGHPWLPPKGPFDPLLSFGDDDIQILKGLGLNMVRLGVMWPGVHPGLGVVNHTYLGEVVGLVQRLHQAGIHTLVDFHQDVFAGRFCGEGVPDWLLSDVPFSSSNHDAAGPQSKDEAISFPREEQKQDGKLDEDAVSQSLRGHVAPGAPGNLRGSNSSGGHVGGATHVVAEEQIPCVGYAVCMTPPEYAKSFPEPLQPRFGIRSHAASSGTQPGEKVVHGGGASRSVHKSEDGGSSTGRRYDDVMPRELVHDVGQGEQQDGKRELQFPKGIDIKRLTQASRRMQERRKALQGMQERRALQGSWEGGPTAMQCLSIQWGIYHFTFAVARAFQDLYENRWGWRDRLAEYWRDVAVALKGEDGILGFDLINEPWVGDVFMNPLLLAPGVADRLNYAPFYDHLQRAIRQEDPSRLLFFEGTTYDNAASGFETVPGGELYANMSVISYHYYRPPNVAPRATFLQREVERKRLRCGWMLTEFGIPNARPDWVNLGVGRRAGLPGGPKDGLECLPAGNGSAASADSVKSDLQGRSVKNDPEGPTGKDKIMELLDRDTGCGTGKSLSCGGGLARSWEDFVAAWGKEANGSSDAALSLKVRASKPCAGKISDRRRLAAGPHDDVGASTHPRITRGSKEGAGDELMLEGSRTSSDNGLPLKGSLKKRSDTELPAELSLNKRSDTELPAEGSSNKRSDNGLPVKGSRRKESVPGSWDEMVEVLALADEHVQSWSAWEYKPFVPLTGTNYGLFQPDGQLHPIVTQFFWRTYPIAVAGNIQSFHFDPFSSAFKMVYQAAAMGVQEEHTGVLQSLFTGFSRRVALFWRAARKEAAVEEGGVSLVRTTEIHVCCNRTMRVVLEPSSVTLEWVHPGLALIRHSREHDGLRITVEMSLTE